MAAYAAGFLASHEPATSMLYKPTAVEGLETYYTETEVEQLIGKRIVPISLLTEGGMVFRHHINTSIDTAVNRTTIVRITDYATRALRSVCNGFVGKKNLSSRRAAIQVVTEGAFDKMKNLSMLNDSDDAYSVATSQPNLFTVQVDVEFTPVGTIEVVRIRQTIRGIR